MKAFTSKPTEVRKPIEFELDGTEYTFNPPKTTSQLVSMMQVKGNDVTADLERANAMLVWLSHGLNREHEPNPRKKSPGHDTFVEDCQSCDILSRLEDPDDPLELDTVMEVISHLMEKVSGRPTT
jgi:hypothetical protein